MPSKPRLTALSRSLVLGVALTASPVASAQSWGQQSGTPPSSYGQTQAPPSSYGQGQSGAPGPSPTSQGPAEPAQAPPPHSNLRAGGLTPPGEYQETADQSAQERELERAEEEDSGRGLEFVWLNGRVGFTYVSLSTFSSDNLFPELVATDGTGLVYGGGLGLRLIFITLGAHFTVSDLEQWDIWTLNGELGIRIPLGDLEPYFTLGGGYASLGLFNAAGVSSFNPAAVSDNVSVTGFDVRAAVGLDYYITPALSLGAQISGEALALTRPGVSLRDLSSGPNAPPGATHPEQVTYAQEGSSFGTATTGSLLLGLHF